VDPKNADLQPCTNDDVLNSEDERLLSTEEPAAPMAETIGQAGMDLEEPNGDGGRVRADPAARQRARKKRRVCDVCKIQQPLRSKHCKDCGRCVRMHDHHCPWIGTCVGEGNHCYFLIFVWLTFAELIVFLYHTMNAYSTPGPHYEFLGYPEPLLSIAMALMGFIASMVVGLSLMHVYLAFINLTTWEFASWEKITYLKSLPDANAGSPFSRSCLLNMWIFCILPRCWPRSCRSSGGLALDTDGWVAWELGDVRHPIDFSCNCGSLLGRWRCNCCHFGRSLATKSQKSLHEHKVLQGNKQRLQKSGLLICLPKLPTFCEHLWPKLPCCRTRTSKER